MPQAEIWRLLGNNGDRIPFIVANASAIEKGDFLELTDEMLVIAHATNVDVPIVGIAAHQKKANDGHLTITGITNCVFKSKIDGAGVTIGDLASVGSTADEVETASTLDFEKGWTVGFSYADGAAGETALFRSTF